jgi:sec-independent protein translocase protein TatA
LELTSVHHQPALILTVFSSIFDATILKLIAMKATFLFLQGVGFQEILLIGLFVLVFFGAKKIPEFMKGLGKGVREFKDSVKDVKKEVEDASNAAKLDDK